MTLADLHVDIFFAYGFLVFGGLFQLFLNVTEWVSISQDKKRQPQDKTFRLMWILARQDKATTNQDKTATRRDKIRQPQDVIK
jgi:hypothetical protein